MADMNVFSGKGLVRSIQVGQTQDGIPAYSFILRMSLPRAESWIRCNVYSDVALWCQEELYEGMRVHVAGEIMNRRHQVRELVLAEIRVYDLEILQDPAVGINQEQCVND